MSYALQLAGRAVTVLCFCTVCLTTRCDLQGGRTNYGTYCVTYIDISEPTVGQIQKKIFKTIQLMHLTSTFCEKQMTIPYHAS
jgi:hypothetical protein